MNLSKKLVLILLLMSVTMELTYAAPITTQEKKKIAERKAKREREKTKSKAQAKKKSAKKSLAANKKSSASTRKKKAPAKSVQPVAVSAPAIKLTKISPVTSSQRVLPESPMFVQPLVQERAEAEMPTDMPSRLRDALIAEVPSNLKNRIENIIIKYADDAVLMFRNIYLLCWIDDEFMKLFDTPSFNKLLLEVISQETDLFYASAESMAADVKNYIDTALVRFENAIVAGDMGNFEIQQVIDVFKGTDSYREYLERSLRLATEYKQSNMITVLKLALAKAGSAFDVAEDEDFNY